MFKDNSFSNDNEKLIEKQNNDVNEKVNSADDDSDRDNSDDDESVSQTFVRSNKTEKQ